MKSNFSKESISSKLTRVTLSIYFLIFTAVTGVHYVLEFIFAKRAILTELEVIEKTFEPSIAKAIWDLSHKQLDTISTGMVNLPQIAGLIITDEKGNILQLAGSIKNKINKARKQEDDSKLHILDEAEKGISRQFPIFYKRAGETIQLGNGIILSDTDIVFERVKVGFLFVIINAAIIAFALWITFIWVGNSVVIDPLKSFTSQIIKTDFDSIHQNKIKIASPDQEEFMILETAFNDLLKRLFNAHSSLKNLNIELENKVKERTVELTQANRQLNHKIGQHETALESLKKIRESLEIEIGQRKLSEYRMEKLNDLKERLLGNKSLSAKLKYITDGTVEILDADFARIWLIKKGDICSRCAHDNAEHEIHRCRSHEKCLHLAASSGRYTHIDGEHGRVPLGCYKIGQIASGYFKDFLTNDVVKDSRIHNHAWANNLGLKSFAGYCIKSSQGKTIGVFAVFSKHRISDKEETLLKTISASASEVIQVNYIRDLLVESEKKYRTLFENAQVGMFQARVADGKMVISNNRMAQIFGYDSPDECVEEYIAKEHYVFPEVRSDVVESLNTYGIVSNFITQIRINDGSIRWIEFSGVLSEDRTLFEGVASDITEQKTAEEKLNASVLEKETLLKEIHHRVKNNMQIIQSLLNLQMGQVTDENLKKPLIDATSRIKSMALIHETLYRSKDLAKLDIRLYYHQIMDHLLKLYKRPDLSISREFHIEPLIVNIDSIIASGLILNELISNALKYAFPGRNSGRLSISLNQAEDGLAELRIVDDGCGIQDDIDVDDIDSLGLKIVRILVDGQLKGKLNFTTSSSGTQFLIRFPIA